MVGLQSTQEVRCLESLIPADGVNNPAGLIDGGQSRVLMDLGRVGYIDSSGMGAMVAAMKQARALGGDVRLCALQDDVRGIFELTRLARAMSIHTTRQEALSSWR